jgi:hypothetical protein
MITPRTNTYNIDEIIASYQQEVFNITITNSPDHTTITVCKDYSWSPSMANERIRMLFIDVPSAQYENVITDILNHLDLERDNEFIYEEEEESLQITHFTNDL